MVYLGVLLNMVITKIKKSCTVDPSRSCGTNLKNLSKFEIKPEKKYVMCNFFNFFIEDGVL